MSQVPSGLRTTVALAVAIACAVTLAALLAATQAAAGSPTRASWAAAANRDCAAVNAKVRAMPKPKTLRLLIADTRSTLALSKRVTRKLSLIPRPLPERALIAKLLANSRVQNRIFQDQLLPALTAGDAAGVQQAANELKPLGPAFNRMARSLGARICAENPAPQG